MQGLIDISYPLNYKLCEADMASIIHYCISKAQHDTGHILGSQ
jgi:hypothetical protein